MRVMKSILIAKEELIIQHKKTVHARTLYKAKLNRTKTNIRKQLTSPSTIVTSMAGGFITGLIATQPNTKGRTQSADVNQIEDMTPATASPLRMRNMVEKFTAICVSVVMTEVVGRLKQHYSVNQNRVDKNN